ncbi:NUDIX domain-containing protein [Marinobacter fonticola]|uniref:NUDIX domain-containing protein n=1 Tax=Marinobacter fonticola TaxID=2603215 RepID=UPI0011E76C21|nr:NUDIX domain-containing protein [Marinobacter fonticola]
MSEKSPAPFQFSEKDVRIENRETLFKGFFQMDRLRLSHIRFAGGYTEVFDRELFVRGDATCVLPYDPQRDEVVLLEQFRPGALWRDQSPWLLELVAGMNEPGETPEDVAHREAEEEAGLEFRQLEKICSYLVSPGGTTEMVSLYCGHVSTEGAGGLYGIEAEHEDIRAHVMAADEALRMIADGRINNAAAIIALQWLTIQRSRLREEWV